MFVSFVVVPLIIAANKIEWIYSKLVHIGDYNNDEVLQKLFGECAGFSSRDGQNYNFKGELIPPLGMIQKYGIKIAQTMLEATLRGDFINAPQDFTIIREELAKYYKNGYSYETFSSFFTEKYFSFEHINKLFVTTSIAHDLYVIFINRGLYSIRLKALFEEEINKFDALKVTNIYQIDALKTGINPQDALQIENFYQIEALRAGAEIQYALKFSNFPQIQALKLGVNPQDALQIENYSQFDELKDNYFKEVAEDNFDYLVIGLICRNDCCW